MSRPYLSTEEYQADVDLNMGGHDDDRIRDTIDDLVVARKLVEMQDKLYEASKKEIRDLLALVDAQRKVEDALKKEIAATNVALEAAMKVIEIHGSPVFVMPRGGAP
jgi:hypothetical protein